jgi:hypothetical protein
MRRSLAVLAGAPLLMATSCIRTIDLETSPGPERGRPVITASSGRRAATITELRVERCRPEPLRQVAWSIIAKDFPDSTGTADPIVYGVLPRGFVERHPAQPLSSGGCYQMQGSGIVAGDPPELPATARGEFVLGADGTFTAPGPVEVRHENQLGKAAVTCRFAFRRAQTAADTAAVDARVFPVADTTVTCGLMRTRLATTMRSEPGPRARVTTVLIAAAELGAIIWLGGVWDRARGLDR